MRLGMFMQPVHDPKRNLTQVLEEDRQTVLLADQLGYHEIWVGEHTAATSEPITDPMVFLATLLGETKQIKMGPGVYCLPHHHPSRIAGQAALFDHLSKGRFQMGIGNGSLSSDVELFEVGGDTDRGAMVRESIEHILAIWDGEPPYSREGKFWNVPSRRVLPRVFQKPHPRMYLACTQTESFRLAAQKGIGVLSSASYAVDILAEHVKVYRDAIKDCEPVGAFVNDFWGNNVHAFCGPDDQKAKDLAADSMKAFFGPDKPYIAGRIGAYEELLEAWGGVPDHLQADFGRWLRQSDDAHKEQAEQAGLSLDSGPGAARSAIAQLDSNTLADRGVIIAGNPESCIKNIKMYEDIGVDQCMFIMQTETIPHNQVMESIEMFGKEVFPAFKG